jgi:hypothetical protein
MPVVVSKSHIDVLVAGALAAEADGSGLRVRIGDDVLVVGVDLSADNISRWLIHHNVSSVVRSHSSLEIEDLPSAGPSYWQNQDAIRYQAPGFEPTASDVLSALVFYEDQCRAANHGELVNAVIDALRVAYVNRIVHGRDFTPAVVSGRIENPARAIVHLTVDPQLYQATTGRALSAAALSQIAADINAIADVAGLESYDYGMLTIKDMAYLSVSMHEDLDIPWA